MTEDPELFLECIENGWIELQDEDANPIASIDHKYLVLAHKMKAASDLYDACQAAMKVFSEDSHESNVRRQVREALAYATIPSIPLYEG
jgi:dihydroorotase-like cyclic amidohydrolase